MMKLVNQSLQEVLSRGDTVKLDLGCGPKPRDGFFAIDQLELPGVDAVADLNQPLDLLPDNCAGYIYSRHALEHVTNFLPLMKEIHRIAAPGGTIEIIVPHFSNVFGFSDPTHVRFFGLYSMFYFVAKENQPKQRKVPAFYTEVRFKIKSIKLEFYKYTLLDRVLAPVLTKLVNMNFTSQMFYERRLSGIYHAWQITYLMEAEK